MEKIKSLADLKRIKENVQAKIDLREKSEQADNLIQIKIAMATCGIAAGSKETMNYFIENLEKNGIAAVVTQTGCMGYCYARRSCPRSVSPLPLPRAARPSFPSLLTSGPHPTKPPSPIPCQSKN